MEQDQRDASQRLAHNESVFREINERIEAGAWPHRGRLAFLCECSALGCNVLVELTVEEYEHVRASPVRFVLAPGHEIPAIEQVVERKPEYVVVEKVGVAGEVAGHADPRTHDDP
jgi:hypothetical protein